MNHLPHAQSTRRFPLSSGTSWGRDGPLRAVLFSLLFSALLASAKPPWKRNPPPPSPPPPIVYTNAVASWSYGHADYFILYQGASSGNYTRWIQTTNLSCVSSNVTVGVTYYFAVTATVKGVASKYSPEVIYTP